MPRSQRSSSPAGVIGAELQHYQDPERVDLAVAMDGVVAQLMALAHHRTNARGDRGRATRVHTEGA
jgi:hypothetical protein